MAHVEGVKEDPQDIARAGLKAVKHGIDELDTDRITYMPWLPKVEGDRNELE